MPGKADKKRKQKPPPPAKQRRDKAAHPSQAHAEFVRVMSSLTRLRMQHASLRRQAELAVRQNEKRLRQVLETASEAILEVDAEGRILLINRAAEKMFGYTREELLRLNVDQLVPEEMRSAHVADRARYAQKPVTRPMALGMELAARRKDGSTFPVEVGLSPNRLEKELKIIVLLHDVSERKRMQEVLRSSEEKLRQAEKLEALARMAGGTAHEFNNVLTMLMGYSSLMLSSLDRREALVEYIEKINKASRHAAEVTRQLLAFSRRQALTTQVFDLNAMLVDIREVLPALIGNNIVVDLHPAPAPVCIRADPSQIHQVLINLALNARDAMRDGGKLFIKVAGTELNEKDLPRNPGLVPGKYAELTISDTGVGMRRDVQSHVFEPFFSTKEFGKGSGMGLAVIYGIVQQSGGNISVESLAGKGTTFRILLQRVDPTELLSGVVPDGLTMALRGNETILLVEDEASLRELTRQFLESLGYTVLEAGGGEIALGTVQQFQGRIDLLLTDVVMPGMTGREIAQHIKLMRPGIKVLYTSGYIHEAFSAEDTLEPGEAFLEKPFTFEELAAKIRAVLTAANPLSAASVS